MRMMRLLCMATYTKYGKIFHPVIMLDRISMMLVKRPYCSSLSYRRGKTRAAAVNGRLWIPEESHG
jgi:hypothetical protein